MVDEHLDNGQAGAENDVFDLAQWNDVYANAPIEDRDSDDVPDGKYQVVVDRVELTQSLSSGKPMLKWKLKVLGPKCEGSVIWRNNVIGTKGNVEWLKNDLHVCGLDLEVFSDLTEHLGKLLDVMLEITKKTKDGNENVYFNRRIVNDAAATRSVSATGDDIDKNLKEEAAKIF